MNQTTAQPTTGRQKAHGQQVRLRLTPATADQLNGLPARIRAEVATMALNCALAGIPVAEVVGYRRELKNLGLLLNQSLRISRGQSVNVEAVERVVDVIEKLTNRKSK
jgi:hypothetical protein